MIGKILRGRRVQGLIRYLYGPGRFNEHRDPHIVAGFDAPSSLEPEISADGKRDFRRLDGLMRQPLALLGERNHPRPVWHLPLRAHPDDPVLTDAQWADIAAEVMHRTGLAPSGDMEAVRWFALRHADDHIHIVATLARQDGTRPNVWNDGYRVREACRVVEQRYGLHRTAPADRTPARRAKRGETEKAHRNKKSEPARHTLRRQVLTAAASARTEPEFFDLLETEGVLVRKRLSTRAPDQVTGYAVALADDLNSRGEPIWYGGGKLAADLTLQKLRHRWIGQGQSPGLSPPEGLLSEPSVRVLLRDVVRAAAARSQNAEEFLERLETQGLQVKRRFSQRNPDELTGYAVALSGATGGPVWYAGGRLASELTLPRLQRQ
ncbi:relaxase/mobilization nuclease domain-containing protein, partial [Actinomadura adrarensis]